MNAAELSAVKGTVDQRIDAHTDCRKIDEEMVALISRLVKLEKRTKLLLKSTGVGKGTSHLAETAVGFSAHMTPATYVDAGETLVFDEVLLNSGHGYDPSTGVFIAIIPGRYLFSLTVRADYHKQVSAQIVARNTVIGRATCGYGAIERATAAVTVVTMLQKGDEACVRQSKEKWGEYFGNGCTAFSGILLSD